MTVINGVLYVTVDGETVIHDFATIPVRSGGSSLVPSDYADDEFYFSAGSQPQDNTQDDPLGAAEAGEVYFYALEVTHDNNPLAVSVLEMQSGDMTQSMPIALVVVMTALLIGTLLVVRGYSKTE